MNTKKKHSVVHKNQNLTSSSTQFAAANEILDHALCSVCRTASGIEATRSGDVSHPLFIPSFSLGLVAVAKLLDIVDRIEISHPILGKMTVSSKGSVFASFAVTDILSRTPMGSDAIVSKAFERRSIGSDAKT